MLPHIDFQAMERVARGMANRQLSDYLCTTMAAQLPRIPSTAEWVPLLVEEAGKYACAAGHDQGRAYTTYITICFLLGPAWEFEPGNREIVQVMSDPDMDIDLRLDMALIRSIALRRHLESVLPQTLGLVEAALAQGDGLSMEFFWETFQHMAGLRGVLYEEEVLDWLEVYEGDAFSLYLHAPFERERITRQLIDLHKRGGWPLPRPVDPYLTLEPEVARKVAIHALVAMTYGRRFNRNPLLRSLPLSSPSELRAFLQQHRQALTEHAHD